VFLGGFRKVIFTSMNKVVLKKRIGNRVINGHPWIFSNEINLMEDTMDAGDIAEVFTDDGKFIGRGYVNPRSTITVRLLTRKKDEQVNAAFFYNRIKDAWAYRQKIGYVENCRLIFGEADDLPQLIIDKFNDYFVIQTLALGIDVWKPAIVKALEEIFSPKGIYERNDVPVRELEGLEQLKGFLSAPFDTRVEIRENGLRFMVDIEKGQKTGYFLDQQDNSVPYSISLKMLMCWVPFVIQAHLRFMQLTMVQNPFWAWIYQNQPFSRRLKMQHSMACRISAGSRRLMLSMH